MHLIRLAGKWYADFLDHRDDRHRWVLFGDKRSSQQYAARLEAIVARRISGEPLDRAIVEWLDRLPRRHRAKLATIGLVGPGVAGGSSDVDAYAGWMGSQDLHPTHVQSSIGAIRKCLSEVPDLDPDQVAAYLKRLRNNGRSIATSNRHLGALKAFCVWRVKTKRAHVHPLTDMSKLNEDIGRVHERTVITQVQLAQLFRHVRTAGDRCGMTGEQRYWAYRLASELGLLAGEMRKLEATDFVFGKHPSVRLSSAPKRRATHVLPLPDDTAKGLSVFLVDVHGRPFPLPRTAAAMLYADLKDAGIPHRDAHGRFRDFYSLRHTALTNLAQTSPLHVVASVARHRLVTTTQRYTQVTEEDMRIAINKRPAK